MNYDITVHSLSIGSISFFCTAKQKQKQKKKKEEITTDSQRYANYTEIHKHA